MSATSDFAGQLLAEQRKLTGELVKATAPLRPHAQQPESTQSAEGPQTDVPPWPRAPVHRA